MVELFDFSPADLLQGYVIKGFNLIGLSASPNVIKVTIYLLAMFMVYTAAIITQKIAKITLLILSIILGIMIIVR